MRPGGFLREAWEFVPILLLLSVGGLIAVWSGLQRPLSGLGVRQLAVSLGQVLLRVLGYVAVLLALQHWIGMRPFFGW
jgi:hypothetical protein